MVSGEIVSGKRAAAPTIGKIEISTEQQLLSPDEKTRKEFKDNGFSTMEKTGIKVKLNFVDNLTELNDAIERVPTLLNFEVEEHGNKPALTRIDFKGQESSKKEFFTNKPDSKIQDVRSLFLKFFDSTERFTETGQNSYMLDTFSEKFTDFFNEFRSNPESWYKAGKGFDTHGFSIIGFSGMGTGFPTLDVGVAAPLLKIFHGYLKQLFTPPRSYNYVFVEIKLDSTRVNQILGNEIFRELSNEQKESLRKKVSEGTFFVPVRTTIIISKLKDAEIEPAVFY